METVKKYLVRSGTNTGELEDKINEYAETHYVSQLTTGNGTLIAVLSQRSDGKYDDIKAFKSIPITSEEQVMPEGWEVIHHTSKEFIVVNRSERKDTGVQE